MLTTLLVAAALLAPLGAQPQLDLALRVDATRLVALNPTEQPELVLLFDRQTGRRATLVVPARGSVDLRFRAGALDGLELRVVTRTERGMHTSASWSLERLRACDGTVWFDVDASPFHAWLPADSGARALAADGAPAGALPTPLCQPPPAASHIPVITPHDARKQDLAPRLERKPLPPV